MTAHKQLVDVSRLMDSCMCMGFLHLSCKLWSIASWTCRQSTSCSSVMPLTKHSRPSWLRSIKFGHSLSDNRLDQSKAVWAHASLIKHEQVQQSCIVIGGEHHQDVPLNQALHDLALFAGHEFAYPPLWEGQWDGYTRVWQKYKVMGDSRSALKV